MPLTEQLVRVKTLRGAPECHSTLVEHRCSGDLPTLSGKDPACPRCFGGVPLYFMGQFHFFRLRENRTFSNSVVAREGSE